MLFYLGTHKTSWLSTAGVPLMVSHRRLARRRSLPRAAAPWALDSGGFTELSTYGRWMTSPGDYVAAVRRYRDEIGRLDWAAPQDWMCEPWILAETGGTVEEHQRRTIESYLRLRDLDPTLPWAPVLQGWALDDYLHCVDLYAASGVDLRRERVVGLGSVCRRQSTGEIEAICSRLAGLGLRLHGFGVKTLGLGRYGWALASADSMSWSYRARRSPPLVGCRHRSCANCLRFALRWRRGVLSRSAVQQLALPL